MQATPFGTITSPVKFLSFTPLRIPSVITRFSFSIIITY
jgi:hypothetical protein